MPRIKPLALRGDNPSKLRGWWVDGSPNLSWWPLSRNPCLRISISLAEVMDPGSWPGMTENCPECLKTAIFTHQISPQSNKYVCEQLLKS